MRFSVAVAIACVSIAAFSAADDVNAAIRKNTNIPAQGLGPALQMLAKSRGFQIVYVADEVNSLRTQGASGELTTEEALTQLLDGTGFTYRSFGEDAVSIVSVAAAETSTSSEVRSEPVTSVVGENRDVKPPSGWFRRLRLAQSDQTSGTDSSRSEERTTSESSSERPQQRIELEEIVVTGTHIRGAEVASPVVTITPQEMRLSGHNNIGEAIRALPQNFNGGQNPGVLTGAVAGSATNVNVSSGSALNLRGLGPDATLTVLNGTRLAYDGLHQATDVSVIPVAAIERMEILLDGASAIYGSDAVGGVANIILKRDYQGAEVSARYGEATEGGFEQEQYAVIGGHAWGSGGFLITGDFSKNSQVRARQRDYLSSMPNQDESIYPSSSQTGALIGAHQDMGDVAEFALDAFYTERDGDQTNDFATVFGLRFENHRESEIWGVAPSLRLELPGEWSLRLHGFMGRDDTGFRSTGFATGGMQVSDTFLRYGNTAEAAGVEAEGRLFGLPGGDARLSVGGGWRQNAFTLRNLLTGRTTTEGDDSSYYGYGEINLPLVSQEQGIPLITRFTLNGALRYESYDSFGEETTPKIGAIWGPVPGFDIKASWGRSFKVPTLRQQFVPSVLFLDPLTVANPPGSPGLAVMSLQGGNPDLGPERAEIITVGFVARPEALPGFTLEASWFDVDYADRVLAPNPIPLTNPEFAPFVTFSPTVAEQNAAFALAGLPPGRFSSPPNPALLPYDPSNISALVDMRFVNTADQALRGVDLMARYTTNLLGGSLTVSGNANWITDSTRKLTSLSPEQATAGIVFFPAKFRGRAGFAWSRDGFTLSSNVNYIGGVTNNLITPNAEGSSMTTLDLVVDYQMKSSVVGDVGFNLALENLLNERPPFMQPPLPLIVNYDSTNYSALGRVVSGTITKRF